MLNKLLTFLRRYDMVQQGDRIVCAISGGADSVAMAFAFYLLKDKLGIELSAAHFNHHLRGEESDRDEAFVREFCDRYDIPLAVGEAQVQPGDKGLEAAARDARYAFFHTLPGKIATAHTADDNAETVLMHLVRGTGLKGLGGITPIRGNLIRPMLNVTRADVEAFLQEYYVNHIEDSSNGSDDFLRNRVRHHVMPLLTAENPRLAENLSSMALRLRLDEECLAQQVDFDILPPVEQLKNLHPAQRSRALEAFLKKSGVREPEERHILLAESLVFSDRPSAKASFPGGVIISRCYDRLEAGKQEQMLCEQVLDGVLELPDLGIRIQRISAEEIINTPDTFTVIPQGPIILRPRQSGDRIRLKGGTKSLKKLFIDRKIPAAQRSRIPVIADDRGILGVYGIGPDLDRTATELPAVTVRFIKIEKGE